MRLLIPILISLLFANTTKAQHTTWVVKMKGYLFTMREDFVGFQPSNDSSGTSFLRALDSTCFNLGSANFEEQRNLHRFCMGIGDSIAVTIIQNGKKYDDQYINYFYCELELMLFLYEWNGITRNNATDAFIYNNKTYSLAGLSVMNRTIKIVPSRKNDLKKLISNYKTAEHRMPDWLYELAYPGKKQRPLPKNDRDYE